ncbi:MAG: hypothetical protein V7K97_11020 [Nostoc sp.]|uniref:hypothetical protein n=1 Tax=Nostoc sp. TaxID=1180 RepID=UPI002FFBBDA1
MKALPVRLRLDSLSAPTEQARFLWSEALNWAQPDDHRGLTLALTGSSQGEREPRKATYLEAGRELESLEPLRYPNFY